MSKYYSKQVDEILKGLEVDSKTGLSNDEVRIRREKFGSNNLVSKKKKPFIRMFLEEFKSFMVIILLIAAVVSGIIGTINGEGLLDTYIILGILIINALIGAVQEKKAESSLEALQKMSSPHSKVLRDGSIVEVTTTELVPGDIVILETGDIVPADIRLLEAVNLKVQESSMTGESLPVEKQTEAIISDDVPLGDRTNMAFTTGMVTYGRGQGIVVETGMNTEVGKIATMIQNTVDTETPMEKSLDKLGKTLGIAVIIICVLIFVVGIMYGNPILTVFMVAVSLAVAAIPEGLPAVSTIVLSVGVQRMVKRNAIIRTLPSVETLGSASVICSDKTGTLTQNKMTVISGFTLENNIKELNNNNELSEDEKTLIEIAVICSDAHLSKDKENEETTGDPTETSLIDIGLKFGIDKNIEEEKHKRVNEIPFDSERKRMTTINKMQNNVFRVNVKGGLDEILSVSTQILDSGKIRPITEKDIKDIENANLDMANKALRVLGMAYKNLDSSFDNGNTDNLEKDLVFVGMLGMIDPARPEAIDAVSRCREAGITPVMITGDHKLTAIAIAKEVGIFKEGNIAITGSELEKYSDEELFEKVKNISVYARVAPEHKVRIVKAWQSHGEIVSMTGDGVNDAPALKQADIGVSMGIVGTEVAKDASDMILTDDNFATIVSAVEEGRRIYDNILKAVQFLISSNIGEIVLLLVASVLNWGIPLIAIQILWVNLVTDSLPALALSIDPAEKDIMQRKPRDPIQGFITKGLIWRVMYQGIMIGVLSLISYRIGFLEAGEKLGQTMAFITIVFAQLIHVNNIHSNTKSLFKFNPLKNKTLILAILASSALMLTVVFVPTFAAAFKLVSIDTTHWIICLSLAFAPVLVVELFKLLGINTLKSEK